MRRAQRILVAAILGAGLALPAGGARGAAQTLREPAFGLPHFYATTDVELARENGREIAKDRLGQLVLLARVGRGTLFQAFGLLDPGTLSDDIEARQTAYTSSELNRMFENLPPHNRDVIFAYCQGVNDTIDQVYAGALPEPLEVNLLRTVLGLGNDLFGNATDISDQVDPFYRAPGGADPEHPNGGFQFTPEMAMAVAVLEVRNFGLEGFNAPSLLEQLQRLAAKHGPPAGTAIWDDLNYLNDPLAPVSVPDPTTPGFGGPLARRTRATAVASAAGRFPQHAWSAAMDRLRARRAARAERAARLGAWPKLGSYSWVIAGNRSATGYPWLGGFPQTGIQTPSIMHFAENRSGEGLMGVGMEFAGGPFVLIGQTDHVAYTSTTAQLPIVDTFFERIVAENTDAMRYDDEGSPAPLVQRTEIFRGVPTTSRIFWRTRERGGNGGSRPVTDFVGDCAGRADGGSAGTLVDADGDFAACLTLPAYVAIVDGTGAGQVRLVSSANATELSVASPWSTPPDASSAYAAASSANGVVAIALDSPAWLEESTTAFAFSWLQRATSVLDIRAAVRLVPTTHNFPSADHQAFNGIGTESGNGNIAYFSTGYSRVRRDGTDRRLPLDGSAANPLVVVGGGVAGATDTTLSAADGGAFGGLDLSPPPPNDRYENPTVLSTEYIVSIVSGAGHKQTRRIASNTAGTLTVESAWGALPDGSSRFEVYEIVAMPEVINPAEGYTANWNNKAATADPGDGFGRQHRVAFILERLAADSSWDRDKQRQLNADVAGLDGQGAFGRFLVPRLRQAADGVGADAATRKVLAALEAHMGAPLFGRNFADPVRDTTVAGANAFLARLVARLANDIFGDEFAGAVGVPGGSRGLAIVQHAIDSAAGDVPGAYAQAFAGDYFDGADWRVVVRDALAALAADGIPDDAPRPVRRYVHPLAGVPGLGSALTFEPTLAGNRGTWEQIVEVGPALRGEFVFPLGQSGLIEGTLAGITGVDPNVESLQPVWRDWRFVPMLAVSADLAAGSEDSDGDGVLDAFERWYFGDLSRGAEDDGDADGRSLVDEWLAGSDPTNGDSDGDDVPDGSDAEPQDGLPPLEIASLRAPATVRLRNTSSDGPGSSVVKTLTVVVAPAAGTPLHADRPVVVDLSGSGGGDFAFGASRFGEVRAQGAGARVRFPVTFAAADACDPVPAPGGEATTATIVFTATARNASATTSVEVLCKP